MSVGLGNSASLTSGSTVAVVEVGPRDGLQNEPKILPTDLRVELVEALADAGLRRIEVGSFVSTKQVPQMADSAEVFRRIRRQTGVTYSALVANRKGLEAALLAGVDEIAIFAAASETFSHKNINCSIAESLIRYREVADGGPAPGSPGKRLYLVRSRLSLRGTCSACSRRVRRRSPF